MAYDLKADFIACIRNYSDSQYLFTYFSKQEIRYE